MTIWVQGTTRKKAVVLKSKSSSTDFLVAVLLKLNISSTAFRTPFYRPHAQSEKTPRGKQVISLVKTTCFDDQFKLFCPAKQVKLRSDSTWFEKELKPQSAIRPHKTHFSSKEKVFGILPASASVLLSVLPRRSPLRLQQAREQASSHKRANYPKSNDWLGLTTWLRGIAIYVNTRQFPKMTVN